MADAVPASRSGRWGIWIGPALVVALGALLFVSTGRDDAHITYWPAHTLATRGALLNYSGDRVEQSSSLLLVVILGALARVTSIPIPTLGVLVSVACGAAVPVVLLQCHGRDARRSGLMAGALLSTSTYLVYWSFSGMETALAALCGAWLVARLAREIEPDAPPRPAAATWLAVAVFTIARPESGLVAILLFVIAGGAGLARRKRGATPSKPALLAAGAAVAFLLVGGWRLAYFGSFFPQPVIAKSAGLSAGAALAGTLYIVRHLASPAALPFAVAATAGLGIVLWDLRRGVPVPSLTVAAAALVLADAAFVVASGGDWMEGGRFLVPAWPAAAILATTALERVAAGRRGVAAGLFALQVAGMAYFAFTSSTGAPLWKVSETVHGAATRYSPFERVNRIHRRDLPAIAALETVVDRVGALRAGRVSLMSGQMGIVPYHLVLDRPDRVEVVDRRGLVDRALTSCPVTAGAPRSAEGLVLGYGAYFRAAGEIAARCGWKPPDVVYDLDQNLGELEGAGYVPVFLVEGGPGNKGQLIAVSPAIAAMVPEWATRR